jgi:hypothetical protein
MKTTLRNIVQVTVVAVALTSVAEAGWFSDAIGVNIPLSGGPITIGTPQPVRAIQQLPGEIQRLPQTIPNIVNPAGMALALAIRHANAQARNGCQPAPADVQQMIGQLFQGVIQGVCYNTLDRNRVALDSAVMLLSNDTAALTLDDVIVFRSESEAHQWKLWAHELTHVMQYRSWGIDTFANDYINNSARLEEEARTHADQVEQRLMSASGSSQQNRSGQEQFAYFNVNGHLLYGDVQFNLYPADPVSGRVLGPANGRVSFQNGQYWAVDSNGGVYAAIRVR